MGRRALGYSPVDVPHPGERVGEEGRETLNRSVLPLVLSLLLAVVPASSQVQDPATPGTSEGDFPRVELDQLLKLPSTLDYSVEKRGGLTEGEWRSRFRVLHTALEAEREGLEVAEEDLDRVAGTSDAWQVAPPMPGMSGAAADAPLDYRIRQALNRHRREIERLERQLRELEVEANLAVVPEDWRE
jgi:hypothetical protein